MRAGLAHLRPTCAPIGATGFGSRTRLVFAEAQQPRRPEIDLPPTCPNHLCPQPPLFCSWICLGAFAIMGDPIEEEISTSYIERQNLTMRMQMRRFTRLTNAFSKKLENHRAAVALHFAHYNLARIHRTLRVTPAMAADVQDHVWGGDELVGTALQREDSGTTSQWESTRGS